MANAKISALTAVTTPASTDEFAVNQGGTTKKETRAQIHTLESGEFLQGATGVGWLDLRGDSGASTGVRINDAGNVIIGTTTPATGTPILDIMSAADRPQIVLADNIGDATLKIASLGVRHFTNAQEPTAGFLMLSNTSASALRLGGGSGGMNAVTSHEWYTAADTTTTTGTVAADLSGVGTASILRLRGDITIDKDLNHDGDKAGFFATAPVSKPTGVAVSDAAIHAALVTLGLIAA